MASHTTADTPLFSVVSAVYNVAQYLPQFLGALERQTFDTAGIEVVLVDDGSTDDSPALLAAFAERYAGPVTVLTKVNGGQASARNLGIDAARGQWVCFTDPDDWVADNYFAEVAAFVAKYPATQMVATRRDVVDDATGMSRHHPLHKHFTKRNRLRNLAHDTEHFHGHAPCAFFRLEQVRALGVRFDERIRPTFEDVHFCCTYLLRVPTPTVGFVQSAVYAYRKRADRSSTLDTSWSDPRRLTDVPRFGWIPLAQEAVDRLGAVPGWLQTMFLYELSWYFRTEDAVPAIETAAHGEVAEEFRGLLRTIAGYLDPATVRSYADWRLSSTVRDVLLHGLQGTEWHAAYALIDRVDTAQRTLRLRYRFVGTPPQEQFLVDGAPFEPVAAKIRDIDYFGEVMLHERIVWLPFGTVRAVLDGTAVEVRTEEPERTVTVMGSHILTTRLGSADGADVRRPPGPDAAQQALITLAASPLVRRAYRRAWVLLDRIQTADDSAEHLFRWLREEHPEVNAYFVLSADSPDWARLRRLAGKRVVAHGSRRWKLLMLNAEHLISSHADLPVTAPQGILRLTGGQRRYRVTFLQHGVMKDDLSRWFNPKNFELFVTSTPAEQRSVVGDHTGYVYTEREAVLTGLPRFDLVRQAGQRVGPEQRDLLLLAPTWRKWLATDTDATGRQTVDAQAFADSEFARDWRAVAGSAELGELAEKHGLTIAVLLHPDLQRVAGLLDVPAHVRLLTFEEQDVREVFARARVMVTDYSSMSFNAAYIDRPVVYFQFDRERVFSGGHLGRAGYFDYERDGFGPLTTTVSDAVSAIADVVESGPGPAPLYQARIDAAFPQRDGLCRQRVYDAIRASTKAVGKRSSSKVIEQEAAAVLRG